MDRQELWQHYVSQNPQFENEETITLTKAGLRKLFDLTYDMAYNEASKKALDIVTDFGNELRNERKRQLEDFEKMVGDLFS